jgi:hypothetical protein
MVHVIRQEGKINKKKSNQGTTKYPWANNQEKHKTNRPFDIEILVKPTFESPARYCHSNPLH